MILVDLVELRGFLGGGGIYDDVQLSESDGSPVSVLGCFPPLSFEGRSSIDVDEGDAGVLIWSRTLD